MARRVKRGGADFQSESNRDHCGGQGSGRGEEFARAESQMRSKRRIRVAVLLAVALVCFRSAWAQSTRDDARAQRSPADAGARTPLERAARLIEGGRFR